MLFYITRDINVNTDLTNKHRLGDFIVHTDQGWSVKDDEISKGYGIGNKNGNYCVIKLTDGVLAIVTDSSRSFPIWFNQHAVSNCVKLDNLCYATQQIVFGTVPVPGDNSVMQYTEKEYSFNQAVDWCCEYLINVTEETFRNNTLPVYAAESYGVDSVTALSALDYLGIDYKMVNCFNTQYDSSLSPNFENIRNYWGYWQLYYNNQTHIQVTGFSGDESMSRSPMYVYWLLQSRGYNLMDLIDSAPAESYMKYYYNRYNDKFNNSTYQKLTKKAAYNLCFKQSSNDFQMWHLDDALTFTPMRNLNLLDVMLRLDDDALIRQAVNAEINKAVISRLSPKLLDNLDTHKNVTQREQRITKYANEFDPGIYTVI
jgi:hypothetical protein